MAKRQNDKKAGEFLFWLHTLIVLAITVSGLFVGPWWVLGILIALKAQQFLFRGCLITNLEIAHGDMPRGSFYYAVAFRRFLGIKLSRMGVRVVSALQVVLSLAIALLANQHNFRIHF